MVGLITHHHEFGDKVIFGNVFRNKEMNCRKHFQAALSKDLQNQHWIMDSAAFVHEKNTVLKILCGFKNRSKMGEKNHVWDVFVNM